MNEEAYRSIKVKYSPVEFISSAVFLHALSFIHSSISSTQQSILEIRCPGRHREVRYRGEMILLRKSFSLMLYNNIGLRRTNSIRRLSKVRQLLTNAILPSFASYIDITYFM